ncbi:(2Fe-2S)-binding protein [Paraburkholderia susongensis]|uniref:2Fe-2S iron-sulfur cluster binding domain-containing protein n=1 Tax=Paraburkholderia susongensis TaxID=1515439 RepID=A0A1X7IUH9_9BURK|nr:(2Fe-2S)-binding protein [Paraburkholderia susongensis]SMG18206.1 2Fe-2S iron-sulfur cluster binding domain-containing protein [Paraburkholderia susongensis]
MQNVSLFSQIAGASSRTVRIVVDGSPVDVPEHANVAAALLCAGVNVFRHTPVGAAPRAPYCMMGVCFDCLVEIDGLPNQQACMVRVRDGMKVKAMAGARALV